MQMMLDEKVDRVELAQVTEGKANQFDLQRLIRQLMSAKTFEEFQ